MTNQPSYGALKQAEALIENYAKQIEPAIYFLSRYLHAVAGIADPSLPLKEALTEIGAVAHQWCLDEAGLIGAEVPGVDLILDITAETLDKERYNLSHLVHIVPAYLIGVRKERPAVRKAAVNCTYAACLILLAYELEREQSA